MPMFSRFATAIILAVLLAPSTRAGDETPISRIVMSVAELKDAGIAVRGKGPQPFAQNCAIANRPQVTLSDKLIRHFAEAGFSKAALCLAITSDIRYDPETGRQLPLAHVAKIGELELDRLFNAFPLNLPPCFRNGTPRTDCKSNYDWYYGTEEDREERPGLTRVDVRAQFKNYKKLAAGADEGVFFSFESGSGPDILTTDPYIRAFSVSTSLPNGFGYSLRCCEGDDPEAEDVDLATYRTKPTFWSLWFEE